MDRIIGIDLARAFAFIGMVIVNFKIAMNADKAETTLSKVVSLFDGHAASTFVILAGIGASLFFENNNNKLELYKRSLFLFILGLINFLIFSGDIIHYYGIYIAIGTFLIGLSNKKMLYIVFITSFIFLAMFFFFDYEQNWNFEILEYRNFWTIKGFLLNLFYNGYHPIFPWISFFLVGVIIGRLNLKDNKTCFKILKISIPSIILIEIISRFLIFKLTGTNSELTIENTKALFGTEPMPPLPIYLISAISTSITIIMFSLLVSKKFADTFFIKFFSSLGKLSLTLYMAHILIGLGFLDVLGILKKQNTLPFSLFCSLTFVILSLIFSFLYFKKFKTGPFEFLLRKFSK